MAFETNSQYKNLDNLQLLWNQIELWERQGVDPYYLESRKDQFTTLLEAVEKGEDVSVPMTWDSIPEQKNFLDSLEG